MLLAAAFGCWPARGVDFLVHSGETVPLGVPGVQTNYFFDAVNIEQGGVASLGGDVTLTVQGDVHIDGQINSFPEAEQTEGDPGEDGVDGLDDQPTGLNAATSGTLGERGHDWVISGSLLTIKSQGNVIINGAVNLNPKLDGGTGGKGGDAGNGGTGAPNAEGGFGGQGGSGNAGGLGGLPSTLRITASGSIVLGKLSLISLDNLSSGGNGGDGGLGGDGGRAGNATASANGPPGGGGGPPGGGGNGTSGGSGGALTLIANNISLFGTISLTGGPGGDGGNCGEPGAGGDAGNGNGAGYTGGRGGDAGAGGFSGGRGGFGGVGGSLYLNGQQVTNQATLDLSGGSRGKGGAGIEAMLAKGGKGGAPNGRDGLDSPKFAQGVDGVDGIPGSLYFWNSWVLPGSRFVGTWLKADGGGSFQPYSSSAGSGIQMSATNQAVTLSSPINTTSERPLEITLQYLWLTQTGSLDLTLAGLELLHLDAPAAPIGEFAEAHVIVSDKALLNQGTTMLALQLNSGSVSQIEIASLTVTSASEVLLISRSTTNAAQVNLSWFGTSNTTYTLQTSPLAVGGVWTTSGLSLPGQGAWITVPQPVDFLPAGGFYRLHIEPTVPKP
jgi:hypothetical protein